jgi:NADPH:quinone reductase-like Zn-dependent oxidoreductase
MLNKLCQTLGIPLLNIVRKEEQAALLRSEGASHVLVTQGEWQKEYAETIAAHGFNVFFDALGGGSVT